MRPTQGRIVLYTTLRGETWPAIVVDVAVGRPDEHGVVALTVFLPGAVMLGVEQVSESFNGDPTPGFWHWPIR